VSSSLLPIAGLSHCTSTKGLSLRGRRGLESQGRECFYRTKGRRTDPSGPKVVSVSPLPATQTAIAYARALQFGVRRRARSRVSPLAGGREAAELPYRQPDLLTPLEYPRGRTECPEAETPEWLLFRAGRPETYGAPISRWDGHPARQEGTSGTVGTTRPRQSGR
jgi:hypothetical protein